MEEQKEVIQFSFGLDASGERLVPRRQPTEEEEDQGVTTHRPPPLRGDQGTFSDMPKEEN